MGMYHVSIGGGGVFMYVAEEFYEGVESECFVEVLMPCEENGGAVEQTGSVS
jgi:hypothetical protein